MSRVFHKFSDRTTDRTLSVKPLKLQTVSVVSTEVEVFELGHSKALNNNESIDE